MADIRKAINGFFPRDRQLGAAIDARVNGLTEKLLVDYIWDQTICQANKPVWRKFSDEEFIAVGRGVTRQAVHGALRRMMSGELGWISRRPAADDRRMWEYRVHTERFENGPVVWAARTECGPRTPEPAASDGVESVNSTWQELQAGCAYWHECPYLVKKLEEGTSSSSSAEAMTTTELSDVPPSPPAAGNLRDTPADAGIAPDADAGRSPHQNARVRPDPPVERLRTRNPRHAVSRANVQNSADLRRDVPLPARDTADAAPSRSAPLHPPDVVEAAAVQCPALLAEAVTAAVGPADKPFLREFWLQCREAAPDVSPDEVVYFISAKAAVSRRKGNPHGHLRASVVNALSGLGDLRALRRKAEDAARIREERQRRDWPDGLDDPEENVEN